MTLDRSWLRRGTYSPPHFGRGLTPLWEDSTVTFKRAGEPVDDGAGDFKPGGTPTAYWTTTAHVEIATPPVDRIGLPGNNAQRRLHIYIRPPDDPLLTPKEGDTLTWTDPHTGFAYTLPVRAVIVPAGMADVIKFESDAIS
jgi:hypothetical protein